MVIVSLMIVFLAFGEVFPGAGRIAAFGVIACVLVYEPLLIWRTGATLGHRRHNLRIVDDATGAAPPLWRALARFGFKTIFGLFSFSWVALGLSARAWHDTLTNTSVRVHDLARAGADDVLVVTPAMSGTGAASPIRCALFVLGNSVVLGVILMVAGAFFVGSDCASYQICSLREQRIVSWGTSTWVLLSIIFGIVGWRRRVDAISSSTA
jgi:hypothetical protein